MDHVILFRNTGNGVVGFVSQGGDDENESEKIATFPDFAAAQEAANRVPVCQAYPYQIVALDDL